MKESTNEALYSFVEQVKREIDRLRALSQRQYDENKNDSPASAHMKWQAQQYTAGQINDFIDQLILEEFTEEV